jgi:hypothetical protein
MSGGYSNIEDGTSTHFSNNVFNVSIKECTLVLIVITV